MQTFTHTAHNTQNDFNIKCLIYIISIHPQRRLLISFKFSKERALFLLTHIFLILILYIQTEKIKN